MKDDIIYIDVDKANASSSFTYSNKASTEFAVPVSNVLYLDMHKDGSLTMWMNLSKTDAFIHIRNAEEAESIYSAYSHRFNTA